MSGLLTAHYIGMGFGNNLLFNYLASEQKENAFVSLFSRDYILKVRSGNWTFHSPTHGY